MMAPTLTQSDGSPAEVLMRIGGELDTTTESHASRIGLLDSRFGPEMVGDLPGVLLDLFFRWEASDAVGDAQAEFERLAKEWKQETAHLSSPRAIAGHRAYQEIIGMGKEAIPFILRDLEHSRAQWFWALRSIARESPVRPEDRGDVWAMTDAWLNWGKEHRYI